MVKIETNEVINGYQVLVIATPMGHRCGYVGVPKDHKYYEVDYNAIDNIDCHGGLTFSGRFTDVDPELWFIGFDCAHAWDAKDPELLEEPYESIHRDYELVFDTESVIRTNAFCLDECSKIIEQIS
jgi:hypothetical protein